MEEGILSNKYYTTVLHCRFWLF